MRTDEIRRYLYDNMPLSEAMGVEVVRADEQGVVLWAPLEPNINHHRTAFGGSISTLATLACWTYVHTLMLSRGVRGALFIQQNEVSYKRIISGPFEARSLPVSQEAIEHLFESVGRKGKGRIEVGADVCYNGEVCASFAGKFVVD